MLRNTSNKKRTQSYSDNNRALIWILSRQTTVWKAYMCLEAQQAFLMLVQKRSLDLNLICVKSSGSQRPVCSCMLSGWNEQAVQVAVLLHICLDLYEVVLPAETLAWLRICAAYWKVIVCCAARKRVPGDLCVCGFLPLLWIDKKVRPRFWLLSSNRILLDSLQHWRKWLC